MEQGSFQDYRIVRISEDHYQIHKIMYDNDRNPISAESDPVDISSSSIENLMVLMVHIMSALTKPPIDVGLFQKQDIHATTDAAMRLFKGD